MSVMAELSGGLDLSNLDGASALEKAEFRSIYQRRLGHVQRGYDFLLDNRPDALKRFRLMTMTGHDPSHPRVPSFGVLLDYVMTGYQVGIRYTIRNLQSAGLNRDQCMDGFALCILYCGPRGLEAAARALDDYAWIEPEKPAQFPEHWTMDRSALSSGIDFDTKELSAEEEQKVLAWYLRTLGEVPRYVDFLASHEPEMLKVHRNRFETCLKAMPNQVIPATLICFHAARGNLSGIRENVLLARGLGMTKSEALQAVMAAIEFGGIDVVSVVDEAARDVFDSWTR